MKQVKIKGSRLVVELKLILYLYTCLLFSEKMNTLSFANENVFIVDR